MPKSKSRRNKTPKRVLALPDLEQTKTAVLNSLTSVSGQRTYDHAIREFVAWYGSEPRRLQPHRRAPIPHSPRTARVCTCHNQPSARRGPPRGVDETPETGSRATRKHSFFRGKRSHVEHPRKQIDGRLLGPCTLVLTLG